ncbi:hypothetical protein [Pseudomonas sp. NCCP-436]|uniref:hypothetical protein n=1 Tax=Pseudomonas sp. NCCP-436 TaxID=2842481 RepID=UPI001C80A212|nr:hypothetical protein [Pseudomonas sp. NCCP-436]GIZ12494.1 hypothetical protein NCCP436_19100 [Pseudomonas sp. NCCP-436]
MQGSVHEDEGHSTPVEDPRPRLLRRFLASLALIAFLLGVLLGRLFETPPLYIEEAQASERTLQLWFNREPQASAEHLDGALIYRFADAYGRERAGRLVLDGVPVSWRIRRDGRDLRLLLLASRPLYGDWQLNKEDGRWRLQLTLQFLSPDVGQE